MNTPITYGKVVNGAFIPDAEHVRIFTTGGSELVEIELLRQIPFFSEVEHSEDLAIRLNISSHDLNIILTYLRTGLMDYDATHPTFKYYLNFLGLPEMAFPGYVNMRKLLKHSPELTPKELDDHPFFTKCMSFTSVEVMDINNPENMVRRDGGGDAANDSGNSSNSNSSSGCITDSSSHSARLDFAEMLDRIKEEDSDGKNESGEGDDSGDDSSKLIDTELERFAQFVAIEGSGSAPMRKKCSFTIVGTNGSCLYCFVRPEPRYAPASRRVPRFFIRDESTDMTTTDPKEWPLRNNIYGMLYPPTWTPRIKEANKRAGVYYHIFDDKFNLIGCIDNADLHEIVMACREKIDKIERWTYSGRSSLPSADES